MKCNLFIFVIITKEWDVWIYLADLIVNTDHNYNVILAFTFEL